MTKSAFSLMTKLRRVTNSLAVKAIILITIFIACPLAVYAELETASQEKTKLLMQSIQQQGRLIAIALTPMLRRSDNAQLPALQTNLRTIETGSTKVKVFFRPRPREGEPRFFYVASSPPAPSSYLDDERDKLVNAGIFDDLLDTCAGERPLALRYANPAGQWELLSSLTPVQTPAGCWIILSSIGGDKTSGLDVTQPYWQTQEVKFAVIIYVIMAALVLWLFFGLWLNLRRFAALAQATGGLAGTTSRSFSSLNRLPELSGVAQEFDHMVDRLISSAHMIRDSAEENAHAFKTPIAVITQSLEPLKKIVSPNDSRGQRALQLIERATERLDALVGAARQMDEAIADLINPPRERVNLTNLLERMLDGYEGIADQDNKKLERGISKDIYVAGSEDMFEIIIENLLDNALSFTKEHGAVSIILVREDNSAVLRIADRGPGVDPRNLDRIFDRYFSVRIRESTPDLIQNDADHFGMGLWIVQRNLDSIGGTITARNRGGGGLEVVVTLPIID